MTRTTGATDAQIEAAIDHYCTFNDFRDNHRKAYELDAEQWAESFCDTDHRIVRVDDLRALAEMACLWAYEHGSTVDSETIDRITALIGEAE